MTRRRPPLAVIALQSILSGVVSGAVVNGVWFLATGDTLSPLASIIAAQCAAWGCAAAHAVRARRQWQTVVDAYNRTALGEGIEIPHRPPADAEGGDGR